MARLEQAYSKVLGEESTKGQLYGGFYLLLGGFFAVVAAVIVFLIGNAQEPDSGSFWNMREAALVLAALGAPFVFLGISTALPTNKVMRVVQFVGFALCLLGVVALGMAYPEHFNVADSQLETQEDYTGPVVGVYIVGAVMILSGTFTSLIGYYLGRAQAAAGAAGTAGGMGAAVDEYDIPDSVVEKDIEYAMKRYKYAWGEGQTAQTGVQINIQDEFEAGTVIGGKGVARTVQIDAPQVDEATAALRSVRPTKKDKVTDTAWADETTKALLDFRKQKIEQVERKAAARRLGWWHRLMIWLGLRRKPVASQELPTQKVGK